MSNPGSSAPITRTSRSILVELAQVLLLAIALYFAITFAVQTVHVLGLSMFPTLDTEDYLIATRIDYRLHDPARGDIIILKDPYNAQTDFIKRVIALPGETLLIRQGHVFIDGRELQEPYLAEAWTSNFDYPRTGAGPPKEGLVIPAGEYFVMGDNRNRSSDSRTFGPIKRDQIDSRAWLRVWPIDHAGPVDGTKPRLVLQARSGSG